MALPVPILSLEGLLDDDARARRSELRGPCETLGLFHVTDPDLSVRAR